MARDRDLSGSWSKGDRFYIRNIPYAIVDWDTTAGAPNPVTKSTDYVADGSDQTLGNFQPVYNNALYTLGWPPPTTIRALARRFTSADLYSFRTVKVGAAPGSVVGNDVNKIRAVPNPYYAHSQYELTQFDRVMKFTNIPASKRVTLRIFDASGRLVRTLLEGDAEATPAVRLPTWDGRDEKGHRVGSGIYYYRLTVAGKKDLSRRMVVLR